MELSPSLRLHLDALAPYLEDRAVTEVLVAAPEKVLVTRGGQARPVEIDLAESRIRALAERLVRSLGLRARPERPDVQSVLLGDLFITVVGPPRGPRCPLLRLQRRSAILDSLDQLEARGELDAPSRRSLEALVHTRRSLLVVGPRGARTTDFVAAMSRAWQAQGRVAVLDDGLEVLLALGIGDLVLDGGSVAAAVALGADVLVTEEPAPATWVRLLESGRPFVVSLEASDGAAAVQRLVAQTLAGGAHLSRAAAEALVLAGTAAVIELAGHAEAPALRGIGRPVLEGGSLGYSAGSTASTPSRPPRAETPVAGTRPPVTDPRLEPTRSSSRPALAARPTPDRPAPSQPPRPRLEPSRRPSGPLGAPAPPTKERLEIGRALSQTAAPRDEDISEILPQNLLSHSFVGRFGAPSIDQAAKTPAPVAAELPPEAKTPDLKGEQEADEAADFTDETTAGTEELSPRGRVAVERLPTVSLPPGGPLKVGIGSDVWASREVKQRKANGDGLPNVSDLPSPDVAGDRAHALIGDVDSTYRAEGVEMIPTGSFEADDPISPDDVQDGRSLDEDEEEEATSEGRADEWGEDEPSEIMSADERGRRAVDPPTETPRRRIR